MTARTATVVIATARRPEHLADCLAALAADVPRAARDIVVVDNAPDPRTREVAEFHGARWIAEPRPGKSHALNTGVAAATGEVVLFTDDDVRVEPGWTDALVTAASAPGVGAAGGRLLPRWLSPPPAWLAASPPAVHLTLRDNGPDPRELASGEFPYGASLAVPADVLRRLDPPFDPRLGPRPGLKLGHEEVHLAERVRALGLSVLPVPDAVAEHLVDPSRVDRDRLRRIVFQSGFGSARRERLLGAAPAPLPRRAAETAVSLARAGHRSLRRAPTPESVDREAGAWAVLGGRLEWLVGGRSPATADWLAARLAGRGPA